jgi:hypothetical protein
VGPSSPISSPGFSAPMAAAGDRNPRDVDERTERTAG